MATTTLADGSLRLVAPGRNDIEAALTRAYRAAGLADDDARVRARRQSISLGTYGSMGHGGDEAVSYAFAILSGRRVVRVWPKSRRQLLTPLIRSLIDS